MKVDLPKRELSLNALAFMKAAILGVDLNKAKDLYLAHEAGIHGDGESAYLQMRERLSPVAVRLKGPTGRALLTRQTRLQSERSRTPTLEQFEMELTRGAPGFYSQADIAHSYAEIHGATPTAKQRLLVRQEQLLKDIEAALKEPPRATDRLAEWLPMTVVDRLHKNKIRTVGELVDFMEGKGRYWWKSMQGLGAVSAAAVDKLLSIHSEALGFTPATDSPRLPAVIPVRRQGIAPLELYLPPRHLAHSGGKNRAPADDCSIQPRDNNGAIIGQGIDDVGVIEAWISRKSSEHTRRSYRKEAERFLAWTHQKAGKTLGDLGPLDLKDYETFLRNPPANWISDQPYPRTDPSWRHFAKKSERKPKVRTKNERSPASPPDRLVDRSRSTQALAPCPPLTVNDQPHLGDKSVRLSLTLLRSLLTWLTDVHYLRQNYWAAAGIADVGQQKMDLEGRALPWSAVELAMQISADLVRDAKKVDDAADSDSRKAELSALRRHVIFVFFATLGLRREELAWMMFGHLRHHEDPSDGKRYYKLSFQGKGARHRTIPLPDQVADLLKHYLALQDLGLSIGMPELDNHPIIPPERPTRRPVRRDSYHLPPSLRTGGAGDSSKMVEVTNLTPGALAEIFGRHIDHIYAVAKHLDRERAYALLRVSPHWFRHAFASNLVAKTKDVKAAQALLGHASIATTSIYLHADDRALYEQLNALTVLPS